MPSRQDAINAAIEAAELQKKLVQDMRKEVIPLLQSTKDSVESVRNHGLRIKVIRYWPLTLDIRIK